MFPFGRTHQDGRIPPSAWYFYAGQKVPDQSQLPKVKAMKVFGPE